MATTSAIFEFSTDGGSTWKPADAPLTGANALASSGSPISVKARLSSLTGVHTVVWSVPTADELTIEGGYAGVTAVQASDKSCTLTFPGTAGRAYVLEALVNPDKPVRRRLAVHVKTSNNLEVLSAAEFDEANRTYGWTGSLNAAIRAIAAGGGGGGVASLAALTGALTLSNGGGVANTPSGSDIGLKIGFGSDAQGDIPVAGVGGTYARKALGANGTVLTSNGTTANWTAPVLSSVGGATPSGGAISISGGGSTGIVVTPSGNDVGLRIGVTSQAAGDLIVATSGTAWARRAKGNADELLAMDGAGSTPAYTNTPWLTALRVGLGGSTAADVFGTATVQAKADASGGEAFGIKADATAGKGRLALYSSAEAAAGFFGYDETNDRLEWSSSGKAWRFASDASNTVFPLQGEAGNANVGLCGTATFNSMVGGAAIANGTTAPASNTGTFAALYNAAGTLRIYAGSTLDVLPGGTTVRFRSTTSVTSVTSTNFSVGALTPSVGGMSGGIFLNNVTTAPATNPTGGLDIYSNAAVFTVKDPSGNLTYTASAAGAATAAGFFVASSSAGSPTTQLKKRSITINGTAINYLTDDP